MMQRIDPSQKETVVDRPAFSTVFPRHTWYLPLKRAADFVIALALLAAFGPVILAAALAVKLTSRGPAFYAQSRVGKDGRVFRIYKLRSMVHNAEAATGPVWSVGNDPRVTMVGRFLRDTHLDEFPQLVNVLLGQMSLVGPRPERPEIVAYLELHLPHYTERVNVAPGIAGFAQLKLPPDSDLESVERKLIHDLYYIKYLNPWLDIRIIAFTGGLFVQSILTALWRLVGLPSSSQVEERLIRVELRLARGEVDNGIPAEQSSLAATEHTIGNGRAR